MRVMRLLGLAVALCSTALADEIPTDLWVVPFSTSSDPSSEADMVLAQTLQGLTGRTLPALWLDKHNVMSEVILRQLESEGTVLHRVSSVWDLPDIFWQGASGFIVYNIGSHDDHSVNTAVSLCGPLNAVAVDEAKVERAQAKGLQCVYDARGKAENEIFDSFVDLWTPGIALEQRMDKPYYLRDWAVLNNAFTFFLGGAMDRSFRRHVAETLGPGATFYGWVPDHPEIEWISDLSRSWGEGVAADLCVNLSALSKLPVEIPIRTHAPPDPVHEGERIVAFVLSDGDNIQWETNNMPLDQNWFASPLRGQFNMNWELSPLLSDVAPRVLRYFLENATDRDAFVAAGSPGYRYIHDEPDSPEYPRGQIDADQTASYLDASRLSIVSVINENAGGLDEVDHLLDLPQVDAVVYKAYAPYNRLHGAIRWRNGKPAVSYKFLLWENMTGSSPAEVAASISQMPSSPSTDPGSYALINVHAWDWRHDNLGGPIQAVKNTIDQLPPCTRVVRLDDFFKLLKDNFSQ